MRSASTRSCFVIFGSSRWYAFTNAASARNSTRTGWSNFSFRCRSTNDTYFVTRGSHRSGDAGFAPADEPRRPKDQRPRVRRRTRASRNAAQARGTRAGGSSRTAPPSRGPSRGPMLSTRSAFGSSTPSTFSPGSEPSGRSTAMPIGPSPCRPTVTPPFVTSCAVAPACGASSNTQFGTTGRGRGRRAVHLAQLHRGRVLVSPAMAPGSSARSSRASTVWRSSSRSPSSDGSFPARSIAAIFSAVTCGSNLNMGWSPRSWCPSRTSCAVVRNAAFSTRLDLFDAVDVVVEDPDLRDHDHHEEHARDHRYDLGELPARRGAGPTSRAPPPPAGGPTRW